MPIEVPDDVDATVTGTASIAPVPESGFAAAAAAVKEASRRIRFDGVQLAKEGDAAVAEMVLLFTRVPGHTEPLKLVVRAQAGLAAKEAAAQVQGRILSLSASVANTGLLSPDEYQVEAASPL